MVIPPDFKQDELVDASVKLKLPDMDEGKAILLASHNREDIEVLCNHVYEIDNGKLSVYENRGTK